ncbi:MAG: hypothetical protein IJI62_01990 [Lachnospiraceae bacterium]|nr:hypothetical protein [Lachnospiraceae bacterium]
MFFRKKTDPELEGLFRTLKMDMSNNYKDAAQEDFRRIRECFDQKKDKLPQKVRAFYDAQISEYESALIGYTHKDQPVHDAPRI